MTVITVAAASSGAPTTRWKVPPDELLNKSPIPRGLRHYAGAAAIAALGANDETSVILTLSFPTAFVYIPKDISISFVSDDLTTEFSNLGVLEYRPAGLSSAGAQAYELFCDAPAFRLAVRSIQTYRPMGTWRRFVNGPNLDTVILQLADISNDASTAGDIGWTADFWEYDLEQCLNWPINTAVPQFSY